MTLERATRGKRQEGIFLIVAALAMLGVLGVFLVGSFAAGNPKISRGTITVAALAKAKAALIAYAVARDDPGRPGEFPCPTTVATTNTTYGISAGVCATTRLGRLPWRTLGIQELVDGAGEPLWYAVSTNFRPAVANINTDKLGTLTVYDSDGTTTLATQVVAVVFSPGAPIGTQNRASSSAFCTTTSTTIARNICATNYLESDAGRNNATNAGPYIAGKFGATFDDQIVYITTDDFMPKIEGRIFSILTNTLNNYYAVNGYYPYAANNSDAASGTQNQLNCANNVFTGRLPRFVLLSPATGSPCTGLADWQPVGNPNGLPAWFTANNWNAAIHYVVGKAYQKGGSKSCMSAGDCLTVNGDSSVQALFILPGIPVSGIARPSTLPSDYLETAENLNDFPTPTNYVYVTSSSALPSRDRVVALKN